MILNVQHITMYIYTGIIQGITLHQQDRKTKFIPRWQNFSGGGVRKLDSQNQKTHENNVFATDLHYCKSLRNVNLSTKRSFTEIIIVHCNLCVIFTNQNTEIVCA